MKSALALLFAIPFVLCVSRAVAHDVEPKLHLSSVKTFQVSATINAPPAARLSLAALEALFIEVLQKRGKTIDQQNYGNVVSTDVEIASAGSQYAVRISFAYREPCTVNRLKFQMTCPVWEHYELLKAFSSLKDATEYVISAAKAAAQLFDAEFEGD